MHTILTIITALEHRIRYDMVYLSAPKRWRDGQLNLAHRIKTKNEEKRKLKTE